MIIMLVVNTETVPGYEVDKVIGLVRGNSVRAKNVGQDIKASFRNIVGGEVSEYDQMLTDSRESAVNRMVKEAEEKNADAVVNIRFTTSGIMGSAAEILAYGTAVKLKEK